MPIYDYKCDKCGHTEESIDSFNSSTIKDCTNCKSSATLKRQIGISKIVMANVNAKGQWCGDAKKEIAKFTKKKKLYFGAK